MGRGLNAVFTVHRYFETDDKPAFLAEVGPSIRGIATRGELGASRVMIEACPRLEIVSVYGVGYDAVDPRRAASVAYVSPTRRTS